MSEDKLDRLYDKVSEMSERMARVETMMTELTRDMQDVRHTLRNHEERLNGLESHKEATIGAKDIITWLAMAGIALWGVLSK